MAAVVVLYNVDEQHQRHYTGHNDDVKRYVGFIDYGKGTEM